MKPETFASLVSAILYEKRLDNYFVISFLFFSTHILYFSFSMKKYGWDFYRISTASFVCVDSSTNVILDFKLT